MSTPLSRKLVLLSLIGLFVLGQCTTTDQSDFYESIHDWQESRNEEMRDTSESWLSLVGLHWLEQGASSFGSDTSNLIQFPDTAPKFAGTFILEDTLLSIQVAEGVSIKEGDQLVKEMVLRHDMNKPTSYLQMGSIHFFAIQRPEGIAIRVKDSRSPELLAFEDIPNFEIDPSWKMQARLDWFETPKPIQIPTVLGSERTQQCPAILVFEVDGEAYELYPYQSFYGDPEWTIIFSDLTNGESTYGGGRFLTLSAPEVGVESITLDFNKAYNPPCAFSPFATCPIPPPENSLPIAVRSGEKMYGEHH